MSHKCDISWCCNTWISIIRGCCLACYNELIIYSIQSHYYKQKIIYLFFRIIESKKRILGYNSDQRNMLEFVTFLEIITFSFFLNNFFLLIRTYVIIYVVYIIYVVTLSLFFGFFFAHSCLLLLISFWLLSLMLTPHI